MTSQWYRSRLFWLGLVGLVVLVGTGVSFQQRAAVAAWTVGGQSIAIGANADAVLLSHVNQQHPSRIGMAGVRKGLLTFHSKVGRTRTLWVPAVQLEMADGLTQLQFAIWFMLLCYSAVWFGSMVWWLRRKHRLMASAGVAAV